MWGEEITHTEIIQHFFYSYYYHEKKINRACIDLLLWFQRASEIVRGHGSFGRQTGRTEPGVEMIVGWHRDRETIRM